MSPAHEPRRSYHLDIGDDLALVILLSRRYTVEILDALATRPHTRHDLRTRTHAHRRALRTTLCALAAHGYITHERAGSWDHLTGKQCYFLTPAGTRLTQRLIRLDEWTALYRAAQDPPE